MDIFSFRNVFEHEYIILNKKEIIDFNLIIIQMEHYKVYVFVFLEGFSERLRLKVYLSLMRLQNSFIHPQEVLGLFVKWNQLNYIYQDQ